MCRLKRRNTIVVGTIQTIDPARSTGYSVANCPRKNERPAVGVICSTELR